MTTGQLSLFDAMPEGESMFSFDGHPMRVSKDGDNSPWFIASDVCDALDIGDVSSAVSRLEEDEKDTRQTLTPGGSQEMLAINEPGLYRLMMRSNKPMAKKFQRWIAHEVIPQIRKTGVYVPQPKIAPPKNRKERVYVDRQIVERRMSRPDALSQLTERREAVDTFKALMAAVKQCVEQPRYGTIVDREYVALFGQTTTQLRAVLHTADIRATLSPTELQCLRAAEMVLAEVLRRNGRCSQAECVRIINTTLTPLGDMLAILVTGRSALTAGTRYA